MDGYLIPDQFNIIPEPNLKPRLFSQTRPEPDPKKRHRHSLTMRRAPFSIGTLGASLSFEGHHCGMDIVHILLSPDHQLNVVGHSV